MASAAQGEGDAERNAIFAAAFGANPEFFEFYRSMQAYRASLADGSTSFVLSPDSEFFRYFGSLPLAAPDQPSAEGADLAAGQQPSQPAPAAPAQ